MRSSLIYSALVFVLVSFTTTQLFAAEILKVKNKKVLVDLDGTPAKVGQVYRVIGKDGKATGLIKIKSLKAGQAIAVLGKGKAEAGSKIELRKSKIVKKKKDSKGSDEVTDTPRESKSAWGVLAGFNQTTAEVTGVSDELKGTGFSLKGIFDYPLFEMLWFRGALGLEQFKVSTDKAGGCSGQSCEATINYLSFDFWGRIAFGDDPRFWVGGGFDVLVPMSKDSTALEESKITNTSVLAFGGGADIFISDKSYVPVQVEYGLYPKSDTVKATAIALRVGYAMEF